MFSHLLVASAPALITLFRFCAARSWDYEPKSVTVSSSDEQKLRISFRVDRINRGEYALSGEIDWKYDVQDDTMIEILCYRSNSGGNDWKIMPWSIPYQKYEDFVNTFYKEMVTKSIGHCTNMPQYEKKYQPPWPKKLYVFDHCVVNGDGFPEHMVEGYYKVIINITGEVHWVLTFVLKVTSKLF
ncbi:uncharacterized protein LOC115629009 [Scaptodrosophila lebanonensis]|uniref:Uncharacterized protein LOC115629009 n=1 Tax=Drosophila lebanonensis TaxID=7225 RepID=A0A6J2U162_DROLE|nr:uncharacterized protein LOC115629009 [Scaptodrosophila lebanonensis]